MAHPRVYIGTGCTAQDRRYHREAGWYVLGVQFGPMLYANVSGIEEALDEFDERHGERVDIERDRSMLMDYEPAKDYEHDDTPEHLHARVWGAMDAGDVRVNDGGTTVWVDPYEWVEGPFPTLSDAMRAVGRTAL